MMKIMCIGCNGLVDARLTDGAEIYPHRKDLAAVPFWRCDACGNYVGCHHRSDVKTAPLGSIPTKELRQLRSEIHRVIDPIWRQERRMSRKQLYKTISDMVGWDFHTARIRSVEEAKDILALVTKI